MSVCSRRDFLKGSLATGVVVGSGLGMPHLLRAQEPIKVGVLHSLSGTMAISEAPLKDVILMAIEEVNASGGVLGRKVEPIVEDPASNWDLFAEKSKKLLLQDKVAAVFGCWTSVSRKSVLPVFEKNNGLLFYPVQYEGEECSKNVIYTGATINQQATPGRRLPDEPGGRRQEEVLPARLGLRVPAHDEQDPAHVSEQGRRRCRTRPSRRSTRPSTIRTTRRSSAR